MTTALASRIQQARIAAGYITPDAAAIALAVDNESYRNHEAGKTRVKPPELRRYAETFHVSHGWLSAGVGIGPASTYPHPAAPTATRSVTGDRL